MASLGTNEEAAPERPVGTGWEFGRRQKGSFSNLLKEQTVP
jgi:hypothetical protein